MDSIHILKDYLKGNKCVISCTNINKNLKINYKNESKVIRYMEEYLNYKQVRIEQIKEKECLENRTIWLNEDISDTTEFMILRMFDKIIEMDNKNKIKPENADIIHLKISSYGGSVHSTLAICSKIESLKKLNYRIYGYAYGKACSGAFKILISCSKRFAQPSCDLLCHMPNSTEGYLYYSTMEDKRRSYENSKRLWLRCRDIILKNTNITEEMLEETIHSNDDFCIWADESIEKNLGIVDELI
jgi:ATP-dependent protease ClpP protease subunit